MPKDPIQLRIRVETYYFAQWVAYLERRILEAFQITRRDLGLPVHRSGTRHRGMPGWYLRYAPSRKDLPLGERTDAKRRLIR